MSKDEYLITDAPLKALTVFAMPMILGSFFQQVYNMADSIIVGQFVGSSALAVKDYLMIFKYGMPPHGGLGIGLERLTMQLIGEENVRETCLFPRDMNRLEP